MPFLQLLINANRSLLVLFIWILLIILKPTFKTPDIRFYFSNLLFYNQCIPL